MSYPKIHYGNHERDEAKAFLESSKAKRTELDRGPYKRWVTPQGEFWIEHESNLPNGRYNLFYEQQP